MEITEKDLRNFSPSRHGADIGMICGIGLADGINNTNTEIDYSKLNAGNKEQFDKNSAISAIINAELPGKMF